MSPSIKEQPYQPEDLRKNDFENIPVIDVSALKSPDRQQRQKLAAQIYEACTQVGFFYIKVMASSVLKSLYVPDEVVELFIH